MPKDTVDSYDLSVAKAFLLAAERQHRLAGVTVAEARAALDQALAVQSAAWAEVTGWRMKRDDVELAEAF